MSTDKSVYKLDFGKRIKELREAKGLKQVKMAMLLQITGGFLSDVEKGKSTFSNELIKSVKSLFYELDLNWLLTGEGEMFLGEQGKGQEVETPNTLSLKACEACGQPYNLKLSLEEKEARLREQAERIRELKDANEELREALAEEKKEVALAKAG